jgi:hypothetical protein
MEMLKGAQDEAQ